MRARGWWLKVVHIIALFAGFWFTGLVLSLRGTERRLCPQSVRGRVCSVHNILNMLQCLETMAMVRASPAAHERYAALASKTHRLFESDMFYVHGSNAENEMAEDSTQIPNAEAPSSRPFATLSLAPGGLPRRTDGDPFSSVLRTPPPVTQKGFGRKSLEPTPILPRVYRTQRSPCYRRVARTVALSRTSSESSHPPSRSVPV